MTTGDSGETDRLYVETPGTNCCLDGVPGVVTEVVRDLAPRCTPRAAFVQLDLGPMYYVTLGEASGERDAWREVVSSRPVDREEFDRLTEIDTLRRDLGWREPAQGIAREVPAVEDIIRRRIADELDTVAMSQAYRLSGHSGVSVTRLRDRAEELRHG